MCLQQGPSLSQLLWQRRRSTTSQLLQHPQPIIRLKQLNTCPVQTAAPHAWSLVSVSAYYTLAPDSLAAAITINMDKQCWSFVRWEAPNKCSLGACPASSFKTHQIPCPAPVVQIMSGSALAKHVCYCHISNVSSRASFLCENDYCFPYFGQIFYGG